MKGAWAFVMASTLTLAVFPLWSLVADGTNIVLR